MLLTRAEVAERLRVHESTVDRYIKRGLITAHKAPGGPNSTVRISEEALQNYLDQHATHPTPQPDDEPEEVQA
ncbi:helix-turn-helix domain-containing protein [Spirillospora sp. CA-253888]